METIRADHVDIGDKLLVAYHGAGPIRMLEVIDVEMIDGGWREIKFSGGIIYTVQAGEILVTAKKED